MKQGALFAALETIATYKGVGMENEKTPITNELDFFLGYIDIIAQGYKNEALIEKYKSLDFSATIAQLEIDFADKEKEEMGETPEHLGKLQTYEDLFNNAIEYLEAGVKFIESRKALLCENLKKMLQEYEEQDGTL